jgi:hypothetical protein
MECHSSKPAEKDHLGDLGIDERISFNLSKISEGMEWNKLAQDRDQRRTHMKQVMYLYVPSRRKMY